MRLWNRGADRPPLPPRLAAEHERLRRLWSLALVTPIVYLLIAEGLVAWGFINPSPAASHPWDTPVARLIIAGLAAALFGAALWRRLACARAVQRRRHDPAAALNRWRWDFYLMATMADSLAFTGLVYFAVSGRRWALLVGGVGAYLTYGLAFPRKADLEHLPEPPEDEDERE